MHGDPFDYVRTWKTKRESTGWWHSFELPDGSVIEGVCDLPGLKYRIAQFPIAEDLRGKRVLDIGTWDGWFAFEMERRGAEVVAIDTWHNPRFVEMQRRLKSTVLYRQMDVYELSPERVGRFDIVLFMGVLYHLKHPLLALEKVCSVTTEMAAVDSFVLKDEHRPDFEIPRRPFMEFYETNEFGEQTDNWVGPNLECLLAFCRTAGFARVEQQSVIENSACVACFRQWAPVKSFSEPEHSLLNATRGTSGTRGGGINFDSSRDQYVSIWFSSRIQSLTLDDIRPDVSGFGSRPISLHKMADEQWQANFKLPPGLGPGWHDVRLCLADSGPSDPQRIAVDLAIHDLSLRIVGVAGAITWSPGEVTLPADTAITIWIAGMPENIDCENLRIFLDKQELEVLFVDRDSKTDARQVNALLELPIPQGPAQVSATVGTFRSNDWLIRVDQDSAS